MLVGDIYGSDYASVGLKATTIASSFGKVITPQSPPFLFFLKKMSHSSDIPFAAFQKRPR